MVARLNAGTVVMSWVVMGLLLAAPVAFASVESGRAAFSAYQEALQQQDDAASRGDSAAYEAATTSARNKLVEARAAFEAAGAAESDDPSVVLDYAAVLRAMAYDDLAAEAVRGALDRGVEAAALWRVYGQSLLAIGPDHFQDGVDALRQSLALDDASAEAAETWFALGHYYLENLMPEPAGAAFDSALALDPELVQAKLGKAAVHIFAGEVAAAGDIVELVGRAARPYDVLLRTMIRGALYDFDSNRRLFADTVENHYAYARLLYLAGRIPEAILAARRAADLAGDRVEIWNFLGAIQSQMGDLNGAIEAYEASLRVQPDQANIQQGLEQLKQARQQQQSQQPAPQPQSAPSQPEQPVQGRGPLR